MHSSFSVHGEQDYSKIIQELVPDNRFESQFYLLRAPCNLDNTFCDNIHLMQRGQVQHHLREAEVFQKNGNIYDLDDEGRNLCF